MAFVVDSVYSDPCQHVPGTTLGSSVEDLVDAILAVEELGASQPEPATVDGHQASHMTLTLDPDLDVHSCIGEEFWILGSEGSNTRYIPTGYSNVVDELWILDVGGTRVVLDGALSDATEQDRAELAEIVQSLKFTD